VQELFYDSLIDGGFLCLGSKESISFTNFEHKYTEQDKKNRIFRKKRIIGKRI
jgi:chemotaxis protein methyltransferase CheR